MIDSVLLDTSFLISLSDPNRRHHEAAKAYYREFIQRGTVMFLSTIVVSEFHVKQPVTDLELRNFMVLPFNIEHGMACGVMMQGFERDSGDDRVRVKDDIKLIAQCVCEGITHLITEDQSTLVKYLVRAKQFARCTTSTITLAGGFDISLFENGQARLVP